MVASSGCSEAKKEQPSPPAIGLGHDGGVGLMDTRALATRKLRYLTFATGVDDFDNPLNVIAHMERARCDHFYPVRLAAVEINAWDPLHELLDEQRCYERRLSFLHP